MKDFIIIVAGGKGLRMGGNVPKQFQVVGGRPVLMHTLERFRAYSDDLEIILVLPHEQQDYWQQLCREYHFAVKHRVADGGETRFHSVQNGLALIPDNAEGVVGVHDGVRPFVSTEVIGRCYEEASKSGAAIPVVPVVETLRHVAEGTKPRADYRLVQTPQTFTVKLLKTASRNAIEVSGGSTEVIASTFTDDASVVEAFGHEISLVEGNRENIKLTTPFDLTIAEALLANEKQ
ncbi:MAG: 2-C-methyl-D-erythritol 4-phosphate cytidylyltransferase [Prevotella sp.]|nr:2-C-methyl-D-erythritol 4-phosphate cytidylyltransferase [Prevotella sp.]